MAEAQPGPAYGAAVDAIYASIGDSARWVPALQAIAAVTDDIGAIFIYPRGDGTLGSIVTPGLEAVQAQFESDEWATRDLRYERALDRGYVASGTCVTDRHVVSDEEIETHPYYVDLLRPHGLKYFAGLNISPSPSAGAALSVQRGPHKPPFSDEELDVVSRLGKHVESALRISLSLRDRASGSLMAAGADGGRPTPRVGVGDVQQTELSRMFALLAAS
ncbi:helix-turn-helix transcriptional regulator [Hansschlegelia zhihuaiae]|uniref:Helix-turn-helix transcriptional regulator n=1 Tax=Hansschlegelia zhihuaiae TaxID=405005 RepID=A0A4Q0M3R5_9HYPH|nr:helix-turn-helix transcriptional regulator [Hansschlegelia zhihuaiae]RXF67319.1 helix-turn-helix transcriptional regulator [Hansschlegelia zhihuaiae]